MAVDTQKLFYLLDPVFQIENLAGKPVVGGHIEVFVAGTDTKYITWQDWGGARNPFKIPLKSDGRAVILVEPQYTYDVYVYDSFNNMVCSRLNVSPAIGGDVSVSGLTQVYHDETISGNGTPYEPLGIVSGGKIYEGIEPIVVNNDVNKISANNVALGLQEPLFFVEDSETACVIGCSAQTEIPSALSGKWDNASDVVIANSAQWAEHTEYEAGSYVDITDNTISVTGLQPEGDYAYNSALSSKLDVTALPQDLVHSGDLTAYQPAGNYQTAGDYQTAGNYLSATDSANFLLTSDSGKFYPMEGNPSGFLTEHQSLDDYATKEWVEDKGYITGIDIQESAIWNSTTETVSSNSAAWGSATPQIPVTGINGIKISESGDQVVFEVSGDYVEHPELSSYATEQWVNDQSYMHEYMESAFYPVDNPSGFITGVDLSDYATTAQLSEKQDSLSYGYHDSAISSIDESALYDTSAHARINTLAGRISDLSSNKLDSSAFSDVSGTFLTAHQDISDLMPKSESANFYPMTGNPSGFINELPEEEEVEFEEIDLADYQPVSGMTAYQEAGDYYSASNPSGFITGVPDTYLQNTDLTITDGKITEISGVPLSGGGGSVDMSAYVPLSSDNLQFGNNTAQTRSFALGSNVSATDNSFVLGQNNSAHTYSIALGGTNIANGASLSVGSNNSAQTNSLVLGNNNSALMYSEAVGYYNTSYDNSLTVGQNNSASRGSIAVGSQSKAYYNSIALDNGSANEGSLAIGGEAHTGSLAIGNYANQAAKYSQALGFRVSATNSGMAIGSLNATTTAAFVVGNGSADTSTYPATYTNSDAFIIFHDGSVSAAGKISANGVELGAGGITYTTGSI